MANPRAAKNSNWAVEPAPTGVTVLRWDIEWLMVLPRVWLSNYRLGYRGNLGH